MINIHIIDIHSTFIIKQLVSGLAPPLSLALLLLLILLLVLLPVLNLSLILALALVMFLTLVLGRGKDPASEHLNQKEIVYAWYNRVWILWGLERRVQGDDRSSVIVWRESGMLCILD